MACYHPLRAYRTASGTVVLGKEAKDSAPLSLPCGGCLGCRTEKARAWALRCHLELQSHPSAVFSTLTYDPHHLPPTLQKSDVSTFIRRLRKKKRGGVRFFASGEYGERTNRPHYHALLYGCSESDRSLIESTWGKGQVRTDPVTPARIAYCAGYCQKKIGYKLDAREEIVDPETGEVLQEEHQPPFIIMSRRPGIGSEARDYRESWRLFGVHNGRRMAAPRYLHQSWLDNASALETETLQYEKSQLRLSREPITSDRLQAAELLAIAKHRLRSERRSLDA